MKTVAVAIICKTPKAGSSKTRLSPPLRPEECAEISACFIRDLSKTIQALADEGDVTGYAVYTPFGSEAELKRLLPNDFGLVLQSDGDLGDRLVNGIGDLLQLGHSGAILVNSDSPTLPKAILRQAVDATMRGDNVVLSPAFDGGYTLVGLSNMHAQLFADIPWSTSEVHQLTLERARAVGVKVVNVPGWYDVDDAESFRILEDELAGKKPAFAEMAGADAPATRRFMLSQRALVST